MSEFSSIYNFLDVLCFLQAILFGIVLIILSSPRKTSFFLGMFLLFWGSGFGKHILAYQGIISENQFLDFLPTNFYFLCFPLLYLYVKELTGEYVFKRDIKHLIPGLLEFILFLGLFITFFGVTKVETDINFPEFNLLYMASANIFSVYYLVKILSSIRTHKVKVLKVFSSTDQRLLSWLVPLIYIFIFSSGLAFTFYLFNIFQIFLQLPGMLLINFYKYIFLIILFLDVLLTYWVIIYGIKQTIIWPKVLTDISSNENFPLKDENVEADSNESFDMVIQVVETTKCFTNNELTIVDLAILTNLPYAKLSKLIKHKTDSNFPSFINKYRIEEAKMFLKGGDMFKMYTLEALWQEVGFNSKSSFYRAFKKFENSTPSEYMKNNN